MRSPYSSILILSCLLGSTCGTQVGNGVKGPSVDTSTDPADIAFSQGGLTDISSTAAGKKKFGLTAEAKAQQHIFLREGSSLLEMGTGTFKGSVVNSSAFKIAAADSSGQIKVNFSGSDTFVTAKADSSLGSNAVTLDVEGYDSVSAGPLSTITANGITTKSVTYSDGYRTSWDLDAKGTVTELRVTNATNDYNLKFTFVASTKAVTTTAIANTTEIQWTEVAGSTPKSFKDGRTGLVWSYDDAQSYSTPEAAQAKCAALPATLGTFRLPSYSELNTAYDNEIGGRLANSQALDISARYNGYWTSTKASDQTHWTINLVETDRSIAIQAKSSPTPLSVLCVR